MHSSQRVNKAKRSRQMSMNIGKMMVELFWRRISKNTVLYHTGIQTEIRESRYRREA